jgi:hypothetical protein
MNTRTNLAPALAPTEATANPQPQLAVVPPAKPARSPLALNKRQTEQLLLAELICHVAQVPEYAARLGDFRIPAAMVADLLADAATARSQSTSAVQHTGERMAATSGGGTKGTTLVRSLRQIQASARALHQQSSPERLHEYLVGDRIGQSRPILEQASQTILAKASTERPPGVDTDFIQRVQDQRAEYVASQAPQQASEAQGMAARAKRDALVRSINTRRRQIQLAANAAWPPGVPANVEVRTRFRLPPNRSVSR